MSVNLLKKFNPHWRELYSKYLLTKKHQKAIALLDKILVNELPLFNEDPSIKEERRIALLLKIELLRKLKRELDALAWLCLECDLHPKNNLAKLLRDQLKFSFNLDLLSENVNELFSSNKYQNQNDWPEVTGMNESKVQINNYIINPINNPRHYAAYNIKPPSGVILYGPSGCGKTYIARKIAEKIDYDFMEIKPSDLGSIYVHGAQGKISSLFKEAKSKAPIVLFFDEFDALVPNRDKVSNSYQGEVNEFLAQLDNTHKDRILVIAATNRLKDIDLPILRPGRIDLKIFVPNPDLEARKELFEMFLNNRKKGLINYRQLAEYTEYYTIAEIESIVNMAALKAANSMDEIKTDHITDIILTYKPMLTESEIQKLKNEAFE